MNAGNLLQTEPSSDAPDRGLIPGLLTAAVIVLSGIGFGLLAGIGGPKVGGIATMGICAALAFAINLAAFVPSAVYRTERFYDLTGTVTYLSIVGLALVAAPLHSGLGWLVAAMVAVWTLRLGFFLVTRILKDRNDRRFDQLKKSPGKLLVAWMLQGLWAFVTAGCALAIILQAGMREFSGWRALVATLGVALWTTGLAIEAVADGEKRAFRADSANDGRYITSGLWAWSRHPNYFGEILLWTGIAVIGAAVLSGWSRITLLSPVAVYLLLTQVSGVPILERQGQQRWGDEPGYRDYVSSTPVLFPRPPKAA